jgi:prepilin-type N-terminal cleavage/methylation domain-containing protein
VCNVNEWIHRKTSETATRGRRRAMTLLEMTVAILILGIMLAIVLPNFGPLRVRGQLRTASRNLAALLRYARSEAIYGHKTVYVRLNVESAQYRLDLMIDSKPAEKREGKEIYLVEALRDLPDSVYIERVVLYGPAEDRHDKIVELEFTPRGQATPATIVLANTKDKAMTIDLFGTTGAVEAYAGFPAEE